MKRLILIAIAVLTLGTAMTMPAQAADNDVADLATCNYQKWLWGQWSAPMGVYGVCWQKDTIPWAELGFEPGSAGGWAELKTSGWTTANAVVDGDHKWMWHVWAHEMGHQWGHRVAGPYGLKPQIMRVLGWNVWHEEPWADVFSTCLGWMPVAVSVAFGEPRRATASQCYELDARGLLPPTAPRGFQQVG